MDTKTQTLQDGRPKFRNTNFSLEERLDDLLRRMTLEEKVAQLYCVGRIREMGAELFDDGQLSIEKMRKLFRYGVCQIGRPSQSNLPADSAELTNAIQKYLIEETRLGIPALFNEEGLHGLMGLGSTSFPQAIALASTWDPALVEEVFSAVAKETRCRGSNYVYTPDLDLARDPRWGRVEETFGEDPFLVTCMGISAVQGLQGSGPGIDREHVIAAAKHFAVHGQPEGGTNAAPGNISERIIREYFFPPFEAAVKEANLQAVMVSYNEIDGVPSHSNHWLLEEVLRNEWGFEGFVTSDGFGVQQLITIHHITDDPKQAAVMALKAGVDVEVPQGICYPFLVELVQSEKLTEEMIDLSVRRILRAKFLLGLFDESPYVDAGKAKLITNCAEHQTLALEAAHESIILLKNEQNLLPLSLDKIRSISVIGPNAADLHLGGYAMDPGTGTSILQGIRDYVEDKVKVTYAEGCRITEGNQGWIAWHEDEVVLSNPDEDTMRIEEAVRIARESDVVILVLGGNEATCREGWWFNHLGDRDDLELLGRQSELAQAVLDTHTPTIVILINGRPLTVNNIAACAPAILEAWYAGQETGRAVAEILFGEVNPSGKLPITFPRSVGQLPVYYYQKPSAKRGYLFASEEPLFDFGFGLSYTSYSYKNIRLESSRISPQQSTNAWIDVTNTGERSGDEIVELYVHDVVSTITRPIRELRGFKRIHLETGETKSVGFEITPQALAGLDFEMHPVVEPGIFEIMIGSSSRNYETILLEVYDENSE